MINIRVNLYLNEDNEKDKLIVDMLNKKYNTQVYIKEVLYSIAKGENIVSTTINNIQVPEDEEEYEKIEGLDAIEI